MDCPRCGQKEVSVASRSDDGRWVRLRTHVKQGSASTVCSPTIQIPLAERQPTTTKEGTK